jgi:hypothetical protein
MGITLLYPTGIIYPNGGPEEHWYKGNVNDYIVIDLFHLGYPTNLDTSLSFTWGIFSMLPYLFALLGFSILTLQTVTISG